MRALFYSALAAVPVSHAASDPWRSASAAGAVSVTESGASGLTWAARPAQAWLPISSMPGGAAISFNTSLPRQEVLGFGSCFTDTSAYNTQVFMTAAVREETVEAIWGESGLRASVMRMHINSPDYAVHSYNFDNVTDDFALLHFDHTLAYDQQRVVPLLRAATAKAASWGGAPLRLFGSPWSPPGWMKQNNNMINSLAVCLKEDTPSGSYKQAWADYILAWLQAYQGLGITLWGLTPQNEPEARQQRFESCAYDVQHYVEWVGKYLGPTVLPHFPSLQIMAYDHNKRDALTYAQAVAADAQANASTAGTAVHWYDYTATLGLDNLDAIHALNPDKFILGTEACFLESLTFDFENTGFLYAADIIGDLNHWVTGWVAWNSVLLEGTKFPESRGGPNHDNTSVFGDGLLFEFNASGTQRLVYQSAYWVTGHFSRFMRPGSRIVATTGATAVASADMELIRERTVTCRSKTCPPASGFPLMSVAYVDADMAQAGVVVANVNAEDVTFNLVDESRGRYTACTVPALSIQTYAFSTQA